MNEKEAREYVQNLKKFYTEATGFGALTILFILIWAASGAGYFWPLWIIIFGGIGLLYRAINYGFLPQLAELLPFTKPEWEEEQVKKLTAESKPKKGKRPKLKITTKARVRNLLQNQEDRIKSLQILSS